MKITDVRCHIMGVPGATPKTARRNWIFVEVETDKGITGIGEATTEYHELAVKAQVETQLKPELIGLDPRQVNRAWQKGFREFWWRQGVVHTSAMSGVDMALWDILGKSLNAPVCDLLGGRVRDRVRLYARGDLGLGSLEADAKQAVEQGFEAYKHGFGEPTVPFDVEGQVDVVLTEHRRVRAALGPNVDLMLDAAGMFTPQTAHRLIEGLLPVRMFFVEEPVNQDTVEPTLRIKRDFPSVRIALGERFCTRWAFREWFERQAIDVCQTDISHTGGISELMAIAHYAEVYGILIAPHNPYGPVALAAAAHASAAMHNFLILEHCRLYPWFNDVQRLAVPIAKGHVDMTELRKRPGLGVELNMELVKSRPYARLGLRAYTHADGSNLAHQ